MTKTWIAVNVILLVIAALLAWQLLAGVDKFNAANDLARIQVTRDPRVMSLPEVGLRPIPPLRRYNAGEFGVISAQNPFSEARTGVDKADAAAAQEIPVLQMKPTLVGVTLAGGQRLASIIDPASPGGRRSQTKRLGDTYQGYTITDITSSEMVLELGNRREVILLRDGSRPSGQGGKTPVLATRVVPFGGGGGTPVPAAAPAVVTQNPVPTRPSGPAASPATRMTGLQVRQGPAQTAQPTGPGWNDRVGEQGRRVVRTPFGDIVRDKPPNP